MSKKTQLITFLSFILGATIAFADITVPLRVIGDTSRNDLVGSITISETPYGLLFTPHLSGLTPGVHGLHIHEHPSCANKGDGAGSHWDPQKNNQHLGPYQDHSHLGDLPALFVDQNGRASLPVLAPRIKKLSQVKNHALILHQGGDNYSEEPKLGGGGARMWCGVISDK